MARRDVIRPRSFEYLESGGTCSNANIIYVEYCSTGVICHYFENRDLAKLTRKNFNWKQIKIKGIHLETEEYVRGMSGRLAASLLSDAWRANICRLIEDPLPLSQPRYVGVVPPQSVSPSPKPTGVVPSHHSTLNLPVFLDPAVRRTPARVNSDSGIEYTKRTATSPVSNPKFLPLSKSKGILVGHKYPTEYVHDMFLMELKNNASTWDDETRKKYCVDYFNLCLFDLDQYEEKNKEAVQKSYDPILISKARFLLTAIENAAKKNPFSHETSIQYVESLMRTKIGIETPENSENVKAFKALVSKLERQRDRCKIVIGAVLIIVGILASFVPSVGVAVGAAIGVFGLGIAYSGRYTNIAKAACSFCVELEKRNKHALLPAKKPPTLGA